MQLMSLVLGAASVAIGAPDDQDTLYLFFPVKDQTAEYWQQGDPTQSRLCSNTKDIFQPVN